MSTDETEFEIACPRCSTCIATIPFEPADGFWTCTDCSIAFNKAGEIVAEGDMVDSYGFLNPAEEDVDLFADGVDCTLESPIGSFATYDEVLDDEQIEAYHEQLQADPSTHG